MVLLNDKLTVAVSPVRTPPRTNPRLEIGNATPVVAPSRRHVRVQPPTHSGPPSQSLVITTNIPPIIVQYQGRVQSYSRHQIARDLHMHPSSISMYFSGKRQLTLLIALRLRKYFNCSLDYIVDELMPQSISLLRESVNEQRAEILNEQATGE